MKRNITEYLLTFLVTILLPGAVIIIIYGLSNRGTSPVEPQATLSQYHVPSVDHSGFPILQENYEDPRDVTLACLSCHNKRDEEIMATAHWRWERETNIPGRGEVTIGKKNLLNNFCTGAAGNNGSCMRCHIGYGWEDKSFDFGDPKNIDCLVCHDQTGTYLKKKGAAGMPSTKENATPDYPVPDYPYVAQNVGLPKRNNCGICHFYGGGGNNVKHGDLEEVLLDCKREVDIHMTTEGKDMQCIDCHLTENHNIKGRAYSVSASNTNRIYCVQCHTDEPHGDRLLDSHFNKVTCQACHIPTYAKGNATKLYWDWSSAARLDEEGYPIMENDADGNHNYLSIKGSFVWDDHVKPEYQWFNGTADHYLKGDTIHEIPVKINELFGEYSDTAAKIWPVKVHRGKQIYDTENKTLIYLKLWSKNKGEGAFWQDFNWDTAALLGMEYNGLPFLGS